jgi:hypothetical protein
MFFSSQSTVEFLVAEQFNGPSALSKKVVESYKAVVHGADIP